MELNMKFIKLMLAVCAVLALGVAATSATAGAPAKAKDGGLSYDQLADSCDYTAPGAVKIAGGVANLSLPNQMSWAQIRAYPQGLTLSELTTLEFDSNASDAGVVYAKITTVDGRSVLYSPNTQPNGEQGLGTMVTHDVLAGTVRLNDDAGNGPDSNWTQVLAEAGNAQVKDVRFTAGCANPVDADGVAGAQVKFDNLKINGQVIDFSKGRR
jgi:hypothetical protein